MSAPSTSAAPAIAQLRAIPDWRAAWRCGPSGFAAVAPLSGSRAVVAAGTLAPGISTTDQAEARHRIRCVLQDRAMVEGHDPRPLRARVNAALGAAGLGRLDALVLLSRPGEGMPASVTGDGSPAPLVATPDRVSAPIEGCVALGPGWAVVLGASDAAGPHAGLLSTGDVGAAISLLAHPGPVMTRSSDRTLLAVAAT